MCIENVEHFERACTGYKTLTKPDTKGIVMELDTTQTTRTEIRSDMAQYIDFTILLNFRSYT